MDGITLSGAPDAGCGTASGEGAGGEFRAESGSGLSGGLTTGAVARRIGVAPTTLRSWDRRYGIGPAARESGRHRRWAPEDIALLERMCRLTAAGMPPAEAAREARAYRGSGTDEAEAAAVAGMPARRNGGLSGPSGPNGLRRECRGLSRAALRLDGAAVRSLLEAAVAEHGLLAAWEGVMVPALRSVGRTWAGSGDRAGERYAEVEHLLSWHISSVLRTQPAPPPPAPGEPSVLLACVPSELHTLPLEAVAAGLAQRRLPVRMFGAALPARALLDAVRRTGPAAALLWSQTRRTADRGLLRALCSGGWGVRGARTRPLVMAGGPGWSGRPLPPAVLRPRSLTEALEGLHSACARLRSFGEHGTGTWARRSAATE